MPAAHWVGAHSTVAAGFKGPGCLRNSLTTLSGRSTTVWSQLAAPGARNGASFVSQCTVTTRLW